MFEPDIQATLRSYDHQEQEMSRILASLAEHGPKASYEAYARACVRMRRQINIRRQLFAGSANQGDTKRTPTEARLGPQINVRRRMVEGMKDD